MGSLATATTGSSGTRSLPYIYGDISAAKTALSGSRCRRIAILGDSQETSPDGSGSIFIPWLNYRLWLRHGMPSESVWIKGVSNANSVFFGRATPSGITTPTGFATFGPPGYSVLGVQAAAYGHFSILDQNATFQALLPNQVYFDNTVSTIATEWVLRHDQAGAPHAIVFERPSATLNNLFATSRGQHVSPQLNLSENHGAWLRWRTGNFVAHRPTEPHRQANLNSWTGSNTNATAPVYHMAASRWVDSARDAGILVSASFSVGGAKADRFSLFFANGGPALAAMGPWDIILLMYGTNDVNDSFSTYKNNLVDLINFLRGPNCLNSNIPIAIVTDPPRVNIVAPASQTHEQSTYVSMQIADQLPGVCVLDSKRRLVELGLNLSNNGDGAHFNSAAAQTNAEVVEDMLYQLTL